MDADRRRNHTKASRRSSEIQGVESGSEKGVELTQVATGLDSLEAADKDDAPLWPKPYCEDSPAGLWSFLTECCWTFNEADGSVEPIPPFDFLRFLAEEWWNARERGSELIIQKSRRLVVSWTLRGCELWSLGMRRERGVVAGLTYPKAAEHVWRHAFLLRQLGIRRPEMALASIERGGNFGAGQLEQVLLPNGSMVESLNQEGESFQGSGYSWVCMEEFCLYKNLSYMRSQARIVTQGRAGTCGGFVVSVSNASPSREWKEIKG